MKILNHFFYQSILLVSLLRAFPLKSFIKKYDKDSKNVIWIHPNFPLGSFKYFGSAAIFQDLALINSLSIQLSDFKIFFGPKIGVLHNKNLFYSFTDKFNSYKFDSNSRFLYGFIKNLEKQNCKFFPSLEELRFWEDKEYMYKKFNELKIPTPKTSVFNIFKKIEIISEEILKTHSFPFLIKEHFGNHSKGIKHISSSEELNNYLIKLKSKPLTSFAVQELINDDTDYRIIVIGGKIEQCYKREKPKTKEWTTTSTSNGSVIDFSIIPEDQAKEFISFSKRLGLSNAAFDASIKDGAIIVYEVSSSYLTNPEPPDNYKHLPYLDFKKSYTNFIKERIKIVFDLRNKWIKEQLKEII